ncbi:protein SPT2 homolog [Ceratina calcarata]|uniref:Protein SPT2 homolog n=1 Tax=Ceratina calcarata TaxID=156304 RepID=A0AAJ7JG71_9HYME|nr:protein SPT2 homolog [Ceratina calcarata]XP_017892004.1 protein SPT2 homolog [Ceratina calcarata]
MKMDFGTLLNVAQKNENAKQPIACYQTKFAPPKKTAKQNKTLSVNIKRFLAKKEEEERQKVLEEKKKRENLLALRDHKAQSRINKHLKVCKAANKSVLADAVDNENTAVTMAGPSQPDEDDYGYVSQEASAFYNQLMSKYNSMPLQKDIFAESKNRTVKDIASTKDRVKQALKQQQMEDMLGHRRKRKGKEFETQDNPEPKEEPVKEKPKEELKEKKKKPSMPPPINFADLLKIAEKKQHEPIVIEVKPKVEEPERLLTKKQMKEYAKEKEWRERRKAEANGLVNKTTTVTAVTTSNTTTTTINNNKITINNNNDNSKSQSGPKKEKTNGCSSIKTSTKSPQCSADIKPKKPTVPTSSATVQNTSRAVSTKINNSFKVNGPTERDSIAEEKKKLEMERKKLEEMRQALEQEKKKLCLSKAQIDEQSLSIKKEKMIKSTVPRTEGKNGVPKNRLQGDRKVRQLPPTLKPRPSVDHGERGRKLMVGQKRRLNAREEDEYDSELDDFIDDEVEEGNEDYSKCISEIFGYDKNKYRYVDDEDDDRAMESSFAQQLKEEYVSTKIGIMEDLEDMRMEALEKKRKAMLKKKKLK